MSTPLSEQEVSWGLSAIYALWRDTDRPNITLQQTPVVGKCYKIQLDNTTVGIGDVITVQYLPPLAFYNGIETIEQLVQLTFFSGIVSKVDICIQPSNQTGDASQEIEFQPQSSTSFMDFEKLKPNFIQDKSWGSNFMSGDYYVNVSRVDDYVEVDWSSEGYAGERIILRPDNSGFQVLHLWGHFIGQADWLRAGNLKPPEWFTNRLSNRLLGMGDELHWAGRAL